MTQAEILEERRGEHGEVLWLTLNRPQARNALTFAMYDRIRELSEEVNADPSVRVVVFTGAGGKAFAAGTDISQFRAFEREADALAYEARMDRVLTALESVRVPTLAAIAGACTGGGAGIAAACDLRICTPSLKFGFPIARTLGNTLSLGNFVRLSALLGMGRVRDLIFTARLIEAAEARGIGLVSEVVAGEEALEPRALELALKLASHAPLTLQTTKEALRRIRAQMTPPGGGSDLVVQAYMSEDFKEGIEAFFAKRPANWKGR
ncbi:MAG TPA: enoyl-CoA hydratase [Candidatus Dormibacteraeota bacterium]